jgi:hypothetical protein
MAHAVRKTAFRQTWRARQANRVNPLNPAETHKTAVNTGDLYFQNLA